MLSSKLLSQIRRKVPSFCFLHQIVEKLSSPQKRLNQQFLNDALNSELYQIWNVFQTHSQELRFTGYTAVELLQNRIPSYENIEFRTTATPEKMRQMFCQTDIQLIPLKGQTYGSAIIKIDDQTRGYDILTTRVYNNGSLIFTENWLDDAQHRDFTINSISIDFHGNIYDYLNAHEDFMKKQIKFVGNYDHRLKEDPLRILKYFRLHNQLFDGQTKYDDSILKNFIEYGESLSQVLGEHIWLELRRILKSHLNSSVIKTLADIGLVKYLGLPESPNVKELYDVWSRACKLNPNVIILLVALLQNQEELVIADKRLKFIKGDRFRKPLTEFNMATFLLENRYLKPKQENCCDVFKNLIIETHGEKEDLKILIGEVLKYQGRGEMMKEMLKWEIPNFPIDRHNLKAAGIKKGPDMFLAVKELKRLWKETNYKATSDELLKQYCQPKHSNV